MKRLLIIGIAVMLVFAAYLAVPFVLAAPLMGCNPPRIASSVLALGYPMLRTSNDGFYNRLWYRYLNDQWECPDNNDKFYSH